MRTLLCLVSALAACTHVDPLSLPRLMRFDPLTSDPAGLAAAFTLPEGLDVAPGSARITLRAARRDTGAETHEVYVLQRNGAGADVVFALSPGDQDRLRAQQARIRRWKDEAGDDASGSLDIALTACRRGETVPDDPRVTVLLRDRPAQPFFTFLKNAPLDALMPGGDPAMLPECPS